MGSESLFMNPLADPAPPASPTSRETVAPPAVFTAPPAPEGFDEASPEPEIPLLLQPATDRLPGRQRGEQRTGGQARNQGRGNGRGQQAS